MRIMKGVERFLFGANCLLWGVFALGILNPGAGDCHCCDFSKDECLLEMSAYGLTAAWLVAGGIVGRGVLGRWGKWTCAVFWGSPRWRTGCAHAKSAGLSIGGQALFWQHVRCRWHSLSRFPIVSSAWWP